MISAAGTRTMVVLALAASACGAPDGLPFLGGARRLDGGLEPLAMTCTGGATDGGLDGGGTCTPFGSDGGVDGGSTPIEPDAGPIDVPDAGVDAGPVTPPCNEHTFTYTDANATSVLVTGTFSGWAGTVADGAHALVKGANGTWSAKVLVEPAGRHLYKFVVDGTRWIADPSNPEGESDNFGGRNSILVVCGGQVDLCGDPEGFDWRDTVMYFALVDRFRDGDGRSDPVAGASGGDALTGPSGQYAGGDLAGLESKLGYLSDLGVSALWLSAPYDNRDLAGGAIDPGADSHNYSAYHGYWPSPDNVVFDGTGGATPKPKVESRIGTDVDLHSLVDEAHAQHMKVLFDYVMHHADIESGLYRAHNDWFARRGTGAFALCGPENLWEDPYWGTRCAFTSYLPPLDFTVPAARAWSVNDAAWWAKTYEIDGFRLDAIKHSPKEWLRDLRTRLTRDLQPAGGRFYLVGETFNYGDRDLLKSFVEPTTMLDGQFDFPYKAKLCQALFRPDGRLDDFARWAVGNDTFYGENAIMTTWIGNHDIPRAIHFASREIGDCMQGSTTGNGWTSNFRQPGDAAAYERLGLAFAIMMTGPGIPLIYYGDEIGLAGGGDPDNRRMMPWNDAALNAPQKALRDLVSKLGKLRGTHKVLGRGRRTTHASDQDTWVFTMGGCGTDLVPVTIAINRADSPRQVTLPAGQHKDLLAGSTIAGGARQLGARSVLVVEPIPQ